MKAYTNIEQSKKLAEILPLESADMYYPNHSFNYIPIPHVEKLSAMYDKIPCWSLSALLEIIGNIRTVYERMVTIEVGKYAGNKWYVELVFVMTESKALMTYTKELIDACVEIILKLHQQKLL